MPGQASKIYSSHFALGEIEAGEKMTFAQDLTASWEQF